MKRSLALLALLLFTAPAAAQWATGAWDSVTLAVAAGDVAQEAAANTWSGAQAFTLPITVGNGATSGGSVRLVEDTDNGSNYMALKAPAAVTADKELTLPDGWPATTGSMLTVSNAGAIGYTAPLPGTQNTWADVQTFSKPPDLPAHQDVSSSSGALTIDFAVSHSAVVQLAENVTTQTWSNMTDSDAVTILFVQGAGANYTVAWPAGVLWAGGTAQTVTATNGAHDLAVIKYVDGHTVVDLLKDVKAAP